VLVPLEHAGASGTTDAFAAMLVERAGFAPAQRALLDAGLGLYWSRGADLARRTSDWLPPRRRHVAVLADATCARPFAQLLNTSAWTLYASDLDPARSHPELIAYLLVLGDRMSHTGELTTAALETAAWWFARDAGERDAFARAAAASTRPDADALCATAAAVGWLARLGHAELRPETGGAKARAVRGTGLVVPLALAREPPRLAASWAAAARRALADYRTRWSAPAATMSRAPAAGSRSSMAPDGVVALCAWLAAEAPPVVVSARRRVLWEPRAAARTAALARVLAGADAVALAAIRADLATIARHTRAFFDACVDPAALCVPADATEAGYASFRADRRLVAYDLEEPGMERLEGPPLPYAHAMLGARTAHEWGHVADASGFVRCTLDEADFGATATTLARALDAVMAAAPADVRARTAADVAALGPAPSPGHALARAALTRLPDLRANLVARVFMDDAERQAYARHNLRAHAHPPAALWRGLVRYLVEYQYLGLLLDDLSAAQRRTYLFEATSFGRDFLERGLLDGARFDALARLVELLCTCWTIDAQRFRPPRA